MNGMIISTALTTLVFLALGCGQHDPIPIRQEGARPQFRYQVDKARNRVWFLTLNGVRLYDLETPEKIRQIELPDWMNLGEDYSCMPDLVVGPKGEALISPQSLLEQQWSDQLQHRTVNQLRAIAQRHQVKLKGNDRAGILAQTVKLLADPATQTNALQQLTPMQRAALEMLCLLSDDAPDTRPLDLQAALGWSSAEEVENALLELSEWGLVIGDFSQWNRFVPYTLAPGVAQQLWQRASAASETHSAGSRLHIAEPFSGDVQAYKLISPALSTLEILWLARHFKLQLRPQPVETKHVQHYEILRQWPYVPEELTRLQVKPG